MAPVYSSLFLNHRILCLRPWKKTECGWECGNREPAILEISYGKEALQQALCVLSRPASTGQKNWIQDTLTQNGAQKLSQQIFEGA